jgi:hypothetical protein
VFVKVEAFELAAFGHAQCAGSLHAVHQRGRDDDRGRRAFVGFTAAPSLNVVSIRARDQVRCGRQSGNNGDVLVVSGEQHRILNVNGCGIQIVRGVWSRERTQHQGDEEASAPAHHHRTTTGSKASAPKHQKLLLLSRPLPARGGLIRRLFEQIVQCAIAQDSQTRWFMRIVTTLSRNGPAAKGVIFGVSRILDEEQS